MRNHLTAASLAALALALGGIAAAPSAQAQISIGVNVGLAPPPLPLEAQPPIPGYGYLWTPGYWSWDASFNSYYWVPGEWVQPPQVGVYWTPGYWGWNNGAFIFNSGYWGPTVGYYGGVNYGYGYEGRGFEGGEWRGGRLYYNRAVTNFGGRRIATVFSRPVAPLGASRVSFVGGRGGLNVRPTPAELAASRAHHIKATAEQVRQAHAAATNPELRADAVKAKPKIAAGRTMPAKTATGAGAAGKAVNPAGRPANARGNERGNESVRAGGATGAGGPSARANRGVHENRPVNPAAGPPGESATPPGERRRVRPGPASESATGRADQTMSRTDRSMGVQRAAPERMPMARPERTGPAGAMRAKPEGGPANSPGREPAAKARPAGGPAGDKKNPPA
ncbi:MAG TPA: hypothetical protein VG166_12405 [Caulobacteraceae bacterium]|nr:hypothetical protein [Caulobacteraceae bacterium]